MDILKELLGNGSVNMNATYTWPKMQKKRCFICGPFRDSLLGNWLVTRLYNNEFNPNSVIISHAAIKIWQYFTMLCVLRRLFNFYGYERMFTRLGNKWFEGDHFFKWLIALTGGPGLFFSSVIILYTDGRIPWTSNKPVARPLPIHGTTQTQVKRIHRAVL
jgi:hypothetical protein